MGTCEVSQKFVKERFICFDVYWKQTNTHTPRQAKFIDRLANKAPLIENYLNFLHS